MAQWDEFSRLRPDLAAAGHKLFYQFGPGLAFLATSRPDGGPRVHPMFPLLTTDGLFAFIVPGPKREDLLATVATRCTPFLPMTTRTPSTSPAAQCR